MNAFTLNPRFVHDLGDGAVLATYIPAGCWAVRVAPVGEDWLAFAAPRNGNTAEPFELASGTDEDAVRALAIRWASSASVGLPLDRVIYRGRDRADEVALLDALLPQAVAA